MSGLLSIVAVTLLAHDADVVYVSLEPTTRAELWREIVTLTPGSLALLAPIDVNGDNSLDQRDLDQSTTALAAGVWSQMLLTTPAGRCERSGERAVLRDGYVELSATFACPAGELTQDFRWLSILPTTYRVVLGSQMQGERGRAFAQGVSTVLHPPRPQGAARPSSSDVKAQWVSGLTLPFRQPAFLALLLATALAVTRWRRIFGVALAVASAAAIAGAAAQPLPALGSAVCLAAAAALAVFRAPWWAAMVAALGFGACSGVPSPMIGLGLAAGLLTMALPIGALAGLLSRRSGLGRAVALTILAVAGFWLVEEWRNYGA